MSHFTAQGIAYVTCEWTLTTIQFLVVLTRLYSRIFLTRSVGSDDFAIAIASCLLWVCTVIDFESFLNGLGKHETDLSDSQASKELYWSTISFFVVYITFFLIRISVALFVLRLLPSYKKTQRRIIYLVILVNFAISAYANITYGLSCRPLKANWDEVPDAKCFSKRLLVVTSQVNAALSCVCDIVTALVPQFLLWNVQMSTKTKRQLNVIFYLGLITAALSIGRAATTTEKSLTEDTTWNLMPAYFFSLFELELGMMFACGPALRQFYAYRKRTHSYLPTKERQYPNQDFEKMRYRINARDIFWYRNAQTKEGRVFDAHSIWGSNSSPPPGATEGSTSNTPKVSGSILDVWERRIGNMFRGGKSQPNQRPSSLKPLHGSSSDTSGSPPTSDDPTDRGIQTKYGKRTLGTTSKAKKIGDSSGGTTRPTFLLSNSAAGESNAVTGNSEPMSPIEDSELANELANPKLRGFP